MGASGGWQNPTLRHCIVSWDQQTPLYLNEKYHYQQSTSEFYHMNSDLKITSSESRPTVCIRGKSGADLLPQASIPDPMTRPASSSQQQMQAGKTLTELLRAGRRAFKSILMECGSICLDIRLMRSDRLIYIWNRVRVNRELNFLNTADHKYLLLHPRQG